MLRNIRPMLLDIMGLRDRFSALSMVPTEPQAADDTQLRSGSPDNATWDRGRHPMAKADKPVRMAVRSTPPPVAPADARRVRWTLIVAPIATSLAAMAAGWLLYRGDVTGHGEMAIPAPTRGSDDVMQVTLMPQGGQPLARELPMTQRVLENQAAIEQGQAPASTGGGETAEAKEASERDAATVRQALQEERARADELARDIDAARREIEALMAASRAASGEIWQVRQDAMRTTQELQRSQQQERDRAENLTRELAAARREMERQAAALADKAAQNLELSDLRQRLGQMEGQLAPFQKSLAQERERSRWLEEKLATHRDPKPDGDGSRPTAPLPGTDKPVMPPIDSAAGIVARPPVPEPDGNPAISRLMARASLLLSQGDIGAARVVLEHTAEMGSAPALFSLAETYDPMILSAWGAIGTQGDVAKAQELYAKALAGGAQQAKDRLNAFASGK